MSTLRFHILVFILMALAVLSGPPRRKHGPQPMTTPSPLQTLRDALGEANNALGWASSMLIEGVEFYTVREVLHAAQKDAMKCHQALTRAESALRELEAEHIQRAIREDFSARHVVDEIGPLPVDISWDTDGADPRYTVEEVLGAALTPTSPFEIDIIKRRLAERGEK